MQGIIQEHEVSKALPFLRKIRGAEKAFIQISGLKTINELYDSAAHLHGFDFVAKLIENLQIELDVDLQDLKKIPENKPFVLVSNHPFGGLDGLILMYLLLPHRPDFKLMANFVLSRINPLSKQLIAVNPFDSTVSKQSSFTGIKEALMHLKAGNCLGVFPAGEVSTIQLNEKRLTDKKWSTSVARLIQKAEVEVIPIHFSGGNSNMFHAIGLLSEKARTVSLAKELTNKKNCRVTVRFGNAIKVSDIRSIKNKDELSRFLRAKTYLLGSDIKVNRFFKPLNVTSDKELPEKLVAPVPGHIIDQEFQKLAANKVKSQAEFDLYMVLAEDIPMAMQEIGRLREQTFREVGEGTLKATDIDEYDLYYHHLILYDREAKRIAGAYRLVNGKVLFEQLGKRGFYTHTLFKMKSPFAQVLSNSAELGRSFIVQDYQNKRLPLFMLWQGILDSVQKFGCRYVIGPVSISNNYTRKSQWLMVEFIKQNHFNETMANWVKPRNKFKLSRPPSEIKNMLSFAKSDMQLLDKIIKDIETSNQAVPVLVKKYIKQNAKMIAFNLDPAFNNTLDGLMVLDLNEMPTNSLMNLKKDLL